jgi:formylmethanofuran dehydrogenase subunit E
MKRRAAQNRETRDLRRSKEVQELKQENRLLKKRISHLRKEISRPPPPDIDDVDEEPTTLGVAPPVNYADMCSKCNGEVTKFTIPDGRSLIVCKKCHDKHVA